MIVNIKLLLILILILIVFAILNKSKDNFYETKLNLKINSDEILDNSKIKMLTFRNLTLLKETLNL